MVHCDQKAGKRIEEEGEDGGDQGDGNDEKTHPGDDKEVGKESDDRDPVEMERNKGCGSQDGDNGDNEREPHIFPYLLFP